MAGKQIYEFRVFQCRIFVAPIIAKDDRQGGEGAGVHWSPPTSAGYQPNDDQLAVQAFHNFYRIDQSFQSKPSGTGERIS